MRCSSPHWRCDLMMKLPPQVNTAFEMLEAAGYEAYLVGGAVRDYVRDNSPAKDWDITTNALPEQVEEIFTGYHDMPITADRKPIKRLLSKHGEDATRQLIELHKADTLGQSAICRHRIAIFEEVSQMINEILQEESCFTLKDLAVNGHDMMTLGFQGPTIGRVLQECLDAVLDEQIPNEHETLMAFAKDRQLKS